MHRITLLILLALLACTAAAAENAALAKYGAQISITCDNPKPLNDRWAKSADLLKETKPAGPIINDLASARIALRFPMVMDLRRIGVAMMGKKDGWARAGTIDVQVDGKSIGTLTLDIENVELQTFDVTPTKTDQVTLVVTKSLPEGNKTVYGGFSQVVAIVDDNLSERFAPPPTPERIPAIMPTANLDLRSAIAVLGQPRKATGHPCTIWDAQDIAELKQQIATIPAAKDAYERCVAFCEDACAKPREVPEKPDDDIDKAAAAGHTRAVETISNLGIGYALSGDERYAKEAARMLLRYADLYEGWEVHGSPKFRHDKSKWSWQRLGDAIWLIQAAWGFDLIHNSPSLSDADRAKIRDHFIMPCVKQILSSPGIIAAPTNWSVICCAAVMIGARVSGDEKTYRMAIDGLALRGNAKISEITDADVPSNHNGGIYFHLDKGIDDDGLWAEGAIGYQFMAIRGLVVMAEILWRDGIDVWGYRNGRMKLVFDSPIWYHYPGGRSSPAIHDSGSTSLFGRDAHLYQYALRRYGDPTYNAVLSRVSPSLASVYNLFLPAFDFAPVPTSGLPPIPTTLFPGVGFATARTGDGDDAKYLLMDYGPNRSHGHPDKLSHCFYALGQELFADGGSAWYSTDIYRDYYSHTLAHNTVLANGQSQIATGGRLEAFCQAGDVALMRGTCGSAIPATGLDRTLVLLGDRLYDIYLVDAKAGPFTFDLPLHSHGTISADGDLAAALGEWTHEDRSKKGYTYFNGATAATWDGDWSCTWTLKRGIMRMHAIGEKGSELIFARTPKGGGELGTVMLRRHTQNTVFATASDIIAKGNSDSLAGLKAITTEHGTTLVATLADGGTEIILVNRGVDRITLGEWTTDAAVVALRLRNGVISECVIAGGTTLSGPGAAITLSASGLVSAYSAGDALKRVTNHGESPLQVTWTGLVAKQYSPVDATGSWTATSAITDGAFTLPARSGADLHQGGTQTVAAFDAERRKAQQQAAWDAEQARLAKQAAETAERQAAAAQERTPDTAVVVMQAEDLSAQGGGEVSITDKKAATFGTSVTQWNDRGHWLEYRCQVAHSGWYQLAIKYCLEGDENTRKILVDGQSLHADLEQIIFPGTGGWSNGADQWNLMPLSLPGSEEPFIFRLEQGEHTLRLDSPGGGLNLDYLVLIPAQVPVSRSVVEPQP